MTSSVVDSHPVLMHYTTAAGLKGIVETGCLWATNALFLNDAQELVHYFDVRLPKLVEEVAVSYLDNACKDHRKAAEIERLGGRQRLTVNAVDSLVSHLKDKTLGYIDPFVFSFSVPISDLAKEHGLLSQWRGYGLDGGYAIVFSSAGIEEFLKSEESTFHYQHLEWGDVFYYGIGSEQQATHDVDNAESILRAEIENMIDNSTPRSHMDVYFALVTLSCLSKHWGFFEEREVRVVAVPQKDGSDIINTDSSGRVTKVQNFFTKNGVLSPYIALQGDATKRRKLPIEAVIVGPHNDKEVRRKSAERLLRENGYSAPVRVSGIPYIGR